MRIYILSLAFFIGRLYLMSKVKLVESTQYNNNKSVCSTVYSVRVSDYVPYEETYRKSSFIFFTKTKSRINYKTQWRTEWRAEDICCTGYNNINTSSDLKCVPECTPECEFGFCYKPDICHCHSGYVKSATNDHVCVPVCENDCIEGRCTEPNTCTCHKGFKMSSDPSVCVPDCPQDCGKFEYCAAPGVCQCIPEYKSDNFGGNFSSSLSSLDCKPICNRSCVNGLCTAPNVCSCLEGYAKVGHEDFSCTPVCSKGCQFGYCDAPDVCICDKGYSTSSKHGSHICEPDCSQPCINGECIAPEVCSCLDGYVTSDNSTHECEPYCSQSCINGMCIAPETCSCFDGFQLAENSTYDCGPVCSQTCENGRCTAPEICTCNENYELDRTNDTCLFQCDCTNGFCIEPNTTCYCNSGYELSGDGNTTYCAPQCNKGCDNGTCVAPNICECHNGYVQNEDAKVNVSSIRVCDICVNGVYLTKEKKCQCFHGWEGEGCDQPFLCRVELNETDRLSLTEEGISVELQQTDKTSIANFYLSWNGPNCSRNDLSRITNSTDCYPASEVDEVRKIICFLNINVENQAFGPTEKISLIGLIAASLLLMIIGVSFISFLYVRRRLKIDDASLLLVAVHHVVTND